MANGWMDVEAMEALSVIRHPSFWRVGPLALARFIASRKLCEQNSKTTCCSSLHRITDHGLVLGIGNHTSVGLASHVEVVLDYRLLIA